MHSPTTYDEIPYTSHPFAQTHPDRLATLGRLFGLSPAPVAQCRVLELGCASGGNLIPMAFNLPDSAFLGIDLSVRQVKDAQADIQALGLSNINIKHESILDIDASWGEFDYIICHGVYSWVPGNVQEKVLSIAATNLAPQGIAFISYNVYPGWHMREMVRHMMRFHSNQFDEPYERIEQSRALMSFLSNSISTENYYGAMLKNELDLLHRCSDSYLFHEHLEEVNQPIYFYQFAEAAQRHGLKYLAESEFSTMLSSDFTNDVSETLSRISSDIIRSEQYMDFVRNRFFRQTLLCHGNIPLKRELTVNDLAGCLFASSLQADNNPIDLSPHIEQTFTTRNKLTISTDFPLTKAAFSVLGEHWPRAIDIDVLYREASALLAKQHIFIEENTGRDTLLKDLLHCYSESSIELHSWQGVFTTDISDKPGISALAAHQLRKGTSLTNQRHETVELNDLTREIALALDGKHTQQEILSDLIRRTDEGELSLQYNGNPVVGSGNIEAIFHEKLPEALKTLASFALLIA